MAFSTSLSSISTPPSLTVGRNEIAPQETRTARLGAFLRAEIEDRIERVSGRTWNSDERTLFANTLAEAIAEAAYEQNLDAFLLLSMVEVESRYNSQALGQHGERGLMQIKPSTAKWITGGVECDLHQSDCNIAAGAAYLKYLTQRTEKRQADAEESLTDVALRLHVLRSYNEGPARADRLSLEAPAPIPYATKIADRAERFRSRFLAQVLNTEGHVTTVAQNQ
jgi:soluble lytic murein transglycosylase-like protein